MLKIYKIKPMYTAIVTTAERYKEDVTNSSGLITDRNETKGTIKWYQTVVSIGNMVRGLKEGDKVMLKSENFAKRKYSKESIQNDMDNNPIKGYSVPTITLYDGDTPKEYLYIDERDVEFVFEGEEVIESKILVPDTKIVTMN